MHRPWTVLLPLTATLLAAPAVWGGNETGSIEGQVGLRRGLDPAEVIVYVEGKVYAQDKAAGPQAPPDRGELLIDQRHHRFVPRVLPVLTGETVTFRNSDGMGHNVFSPEGSGNFNLGTYGKGEVRTHRFDEAGVFVMLCNVHIEMVAWVLTLENPYFTTVDAKGRFRIDGLPPGTYTVSVFKPRGKKRSVEVEVTAGSVTEARLRRRR